MPRLDICFECGELLNVGEQILQLARGPYLKGFETPGYARDFDVVRQYHFRCIDQSPLKPQPEPYTCVICEQEISTKQDVVYAVIGKKPKFGYKRPESRGHLMPFIVHESCYEESELGLFSGQTAD